jgi:heme/copper-type cytochrome/quinol oxidase subunit 3
VTVRAEDTGPALEARAATVAVGLVVGFAALVMTFGALLLAYGMVRVQAQAGGAAWPPAGERRLLGVAWPFALGATLTAVLGSRSAQVASRNSRGPASSALSAAALAGWGFVAIQVLTARHLLALGIRPSSGLAASVLYALGTFHALHAAAAALVMSRLAVRSWRGQVVRTATVRAAAAFVHLVTALWLVIGLAVFVW